MNRDKHVIQLIKEKLDPVDTEQLFDDMLDDCYEKVKLGGYDYSHSDAFKSVDRIAYEQELSTYIDSLMTDDVLTDEIDGDHYYKNEVDELLENI